MNARRLRRLLPDALAVGLLLLLPRLVFWSVWTPNSADRTLFGGDILMGAYPTRVFVHRLLGLGETPLWNPYQLGGMPLHGDIQVAVYYGPNVVLDWLYRGRDIPYIAFELLVIAHYALGAVLMYGFVRNLGLRPLAALVGAIAFEFNGFFIGHRGHYNMLAVVAWLPGILWMLDRAFTAEARRAWLLWVLLAAGMVTEMLMAGHPQLTLYCALLIAAFCAWRWGGVLRARRQQPTTRLALAQVPATALLVGLLGAALAAVALVPAFELLGRSLRSEASYTFAVQYSLLPRNAIGLLVPEFLNWSTTEFRIYAGILTLALAGVALAVSERRSAERRFFLVVVLTALALALGGFTALEGLVYRFLPGFDAVRITARAFYLANFALAVLAAMGAETLLRQLSRLELARLRRMVRGMGWFAGLATLIGVALYGLLLQNHKPVGEEFFFAETLFDRTISADPYTALTQTANQVLLFVLLLTATVALLWSRLHGRLHGVGLAAALLVLMILDMATFAPYHDTINADPVGIRFKIQEYKTTLLTAEWEIREQDQFLEALQAVPPGVRIDNAAEVLPDNYSAVWQVPFATGYNILDIQERFDLLHQWPYLPQATRWDVLNVGFILTAPDQADPPEADAQLVVENSQGRLWRRAALPPTLNFTTRLRPAATLKTVNALLNIPNALREQPPVSAQDTPLATVLAETWPAATDPALREIGTTGVRSPVDLSVLAGGPLKYSAVLVDGATVTPEQRGIMYAALAPDGALLGSGGFDTYASAAESDRLASTLELLPPGTIVALATYDEGTTQLSARAEAALHALGATATLRGQPGAAYALIGVKGAAAGSALELLGAELQLLDVGAAALPAQAAQFTGTLVRSAPGQLTWLVENSAPGLLTLGESVFPGWVAYVDGAPAPLLTANGMQQALILPASTEHAHEVTLVYAPLSVRLGTLISRVGLSLAALLLLLAVLPRRSAQPRLVPNPAA